MSKKPTMFDVEKRELKAIAYPIVLVVLKFLNILTIAPESVTIPLLNFLVQRTNISKLLKANR